MQAVPRNRPYDIMKTSRTLKIAFAALTAATFSMSGVVVEAATVTANLGLSATVVSSCIVSGATLNFGAAIDPTAATVIDSSTSITVVCTATTPYAWHSTPESTPAAPRTSGPARSRTA